MGKLNLTFWRNKQVLLTGHTGFKGAWMMLLLQALGAQVTACALPPSTEPNLYNKLAKDLDLNSVMLDIRDLDAVQRLGHSTQPEIVIHMAAQALVLPSYENPLETFTTNIIGTANLLEATRLLSSLRVFINVTSDKCYENNETGQSFKETDRLGGYDPYSSSKAGAEIIAQSYLRSFLLPKNIGLGSVRAGNVVGGGDWSHHRLIPDLIRAATADRPLKLRHPKAIRPWQHVLEPLSGYLLLAQKLWENPQQFSGGWNFGPSPQHQCTVEELIERSRSYFFPNLAVEFENGEHHEAGLLTLNSDKAMTSLQWQPRWDLTHTLKNTFAWYSQFLSGQSAYSLCQAQINEYFYEL